MRRASWPSAISRPNSREMLRIGVFYDTVEESLEANGFAPNRRGGNQGYLRKTA